MSGEAARPARAPGGPLLALDTATSRATLALGSSHGSLVAGRSWTAGPHREAALLDELRALLEGEGLRATDLGGLVVGLGPGAFTGLRVALATAKTLAYGLRCPLAGVITPHALALAAGGGGGAAAWFTVVQPAGPQDRYVTRVRVDSGHVEGREAPRLRAAGSVEARPADDVLVAVDLEAGPGIPRVAVELGRRALEGLGPALLELGARRLAAGDADVVAALVPAYVTLPRGLPAGAGAGSWSPDLR